VRQRLAASPWLFAVEAALVVAIFVADFHGLIVLSKTPYLLVLAWLSLWARGVRWADLGLRLDPRWRTLALVGLLAGAGMSALELLVTQPILVQLTGHWPDLSPFRPVIGNLQLLILVIFLSWTLAAIGEEVVWRGYLLNRLAERLGRSRWAWIAGVVVLSFAFGLAHFPQGITGVVENTIAGLLLGGLYLAANRNLVAPMVAHGVQDTIDFLLIYAGRYPGM
jgi:membrane protease YdiL (CAAX protease family)